MIDQKKIFPNGLILRQSFYKVSVHFDVIAMRLILLRRTPQGEVPPPFIVHGRMLHCEYGIYDVYQRCINQLVVLMTRWCDVGDANSPSL